MKKVLFIGLLASAALASDLANQYRINGMQGIEKKLDYDLRSKIYWKKIVSQADTTCGYVEAKTDTSTCTDSSVKNAISKKDLTLILSELYIWRYAWIYNDFDGYIKFYDSSFQRNDGMNFDTFKQYKMRIFSKKENKHIAFNNISILPSVDDPKNKFEVQFQEVYQSPSTTFNGVKKLTVTIDSNQMKILSEE